MSGQNNAKYHWFTRLSAIGASALISAFGSAILSFIVLGGSDSAAVGLGLGFPFGFLVGAGMVMWLLSKQVPIWKAIVVSVVTAFLISSVLAAGLDLIDWTSLDLHIDFFSR